MSEALNNWINDQLNKRGWSIRELARRAGIDNSHTSRVLSGNIEPGAKFYMGIAKAFDLPVAAIEALDTKGIIPIEETDEMLTFTEWVTILQELTPAQRVEVLQFVFRLLRGSDHDEPDDISSGVSTAPQPTG